jgi:hypothetical protein
MDVLTDPVLVVTAVPLFGDAFDIEPTEPKFAAVALSNTPVT